MAIQAKLKGARSEFQPQDFTPTQWADANVKAKTANNLTRFILGGFQRPAFTKDIYQHLSNMFGHIAHYDINGFYETWFTDVKSCKAWVEHISSSWLSGVGDPQFTWSDVEKATIRWICEQKIARQLDRIQQ